MTTFVHVVATATISSFPPSATSPSHFFENGENGYQGGCGWSRCVNCTDDPNGPIVPCGPLHQKCVAAPDKPTYKFHLADPTCDINDPNGPMYDPVHGMYHNFYQIHIAEDQNGAGDGPDWGHWVSRDFIHWAQLPVAIWNDHYYDNSAIYTGSTTIVNGKPVMMYPGKCTGRGVPAGQPVCNGGQGGFTYVVVVPKNASDPFYTEWTKEGSIDGKTFSNPVVNHTGDDPSTAWLSKDGEWRIIGNQGCTPEGGNPMYGSKDFVNWYKIGCTTLMAGDCPTFFPLPSLTPGSEHYVARHLQDGPMPDHVHKSGGRGGDQVQVGQWVDGKPGPAGVGSVGTWTQTPGSTSVLLDRGKTHASKDFHDPIKNRQIMWVWGTIPSGIQTVPRHMTYHPGIKQIVYTPVEEMMALHTSTLDAKNNTPVDENPVMIKSGDAADIELTFKTPVQNTTISVQLGGGAVYFDYVVAPPEASASMTPWKCNVGFAGFGDTVPLLSDDDTISIRIFLDNNVGEVYFMEGRVALTFPTTTVDSVNVTAKGSAITMVSATSFAMGDIHTTPESVLEAPRRG